MFFIIMQVMIMLHELFSRFDKLCLDMGVYKVETIGDCYMACTGAAPALACIVMRSELLRYAGIQRHAT